MATEAYKPTLMERIHEKRVAIAATAAPLVTIGLASATDLNGSISPILTDVAELFSPLLDLIVAAVPLIIALAVIGFILGIFDSILAKLRI